ncbi:SusC/RagA family TonB-linked outer membrane protein [uncultured Mucilaginibacter sp.]|uniref:SusC/RagA family TonB-linked outer membrane protein n=1 Tax=uncultured Mucilaginibacter sp. TaxID=797541 RepID=UPI0025F9D861|nr:SusC/RagA family TonB-linked outer membrane protein [uncultured Mucilaginibacter sp.]
MRRIYTTVFYTVFALCVFAFVNVHAQTAERILIKGRVTDLRDKLPVIGATVVEQDKDGRTISGQATDIDGNFALKVTDVTHKIVISTIGYKSRTLEIGARRSFVVQLESNARALTDVVVTARPPVNNGTGLLIDKRDQTTSTVTLNAKDVEELQATSIDQAIQGRLPGVDIVSNSGDPGAGMSIRIRGTATLNGNTNPLIVVDNVPFQTSVPTNFNFSTADQNQYADLLSIAPSDIKDISILKDAAATAVWGAQAANGVLIINTKRGQKGAPSISYTFKGTLSQQPSTIPLLTGDQYSTFIPEMYMNVSGVPLPSSIKEFANDSFDPYYYNNYSQNTDWVKAITRTGYLTDNNLSISGGGDKARYFASVGYNGQTGTTVGTGFSRLNTRLNLDYVVSSKIRFTTFISYAHNVTDYSFSVDNNGNEADGVRNVAMIKMPNMSIYEYNDAGVLTPNYFSPAANIQGAYNPAAGVPIYNPLAMALSAKNRLVTDRIIPHFNLTYNIIPEVLNLNGDIVFDISNGKQDRFLPQIATGRPFTETSVNRAASSDYDTYSVVSKTNLIYTPRINEKHSFTGLLSVQTSDQKSVTQSQTIAGTASPFLQDPSVPGRITNAGLGVDAGINQTRWVAALVNGQYKFLDRYIVNVALRGEGNSRFGESKRYGLFPSASFRYRLSGEKFMKKFDTFLDELSFRGGIGRSGGVPRYDYLFYNTYVNTGSSYLGQAGLFPSNIQLDNLRWEQLTGIDGGLNIILFKNRLNIDLGFYQNTTRDLLAQPGIDISTVNGYSRVLLNVGTLENKGYELSIFATPLKTKNWMVEFNFNIAQNLNTVKAISPYYQTSSGNVSLNGQYLQLLQVNNPLGSFYGYKFAGVYKDKDATIARDANGNQIVSPSGTPVQMRFNYPATDYLFQPGDAMYEDVNHDGNINYQDVVYLGNGNPKFTGGFGPSITFKGNLKLNAFFSFRTGGQVINGTKMITTNMYSFNNQSTATLRRWRTAGDETDMPRALYNNGYNWLGSSRYVESGTFLRFRSITARYTFNKKVASRLKAKNLSAYVTAENLLTFTRYTGQDPEVSMKGTGIFQLATDNSATPPLKLYTLGLTASF